LKYSVRASLSKKLRGNGGGGGGGGDDDLAADSALHSYGDSLLSGGESPVKRKTQEWVKYLIADWQREYIKGKLIE
jgi:hypothetical protein